MHTDELFYMCTNERCRNYYLQKNSKGVAVPLGEYRFETIPRCFSCHREMSSEVERKIELLKVELKIPANTIKF